MAGFVWPSSRKRVALRKEGIVPVSPASLRLIVTVVCGVVLSVQFASIREIVSYGRLLSLSDEGEILEFVGLLANELALLLLILLTAVFAVTVIVGMLQTRFLFLPGLCSLQPGRLWSWKRLGSLVPGVLGAALALVLLTPLALFFSYRSVSMLAQGIVLSSEQLLTPGLYAVTSPMLILTFLGLFALCTIGGQRLLFMWKHRMNREEQQREARDRS